MAKKRVVGGKPEVVQQPPTPAELADAAIRTQSKAALPAEFHPAFGAVTEAFQKYHLGHDTAARERLDAIGLSSPFLEWKVLLRGFLAYTANDDEAAKANWGRLSPDRLPAKLAAPFRARIDPTAPPSRTPLPTDPNSLAGQLREVQANISRGRSLAPAFKALETALPLVKAKLPVAVPKLANAMYHTIGRVGHPDDLNRYRRLFGAPTDDPEFHKLQGRVLEEIGELRQSLQFWALFDGWLSGPPTGWPEPLARRTRAIVQHRMAGIALDLADEMGESPFDEFFGFFSGSKKGKQSAPPKPPDATVYLRKAAELAPDWDAPAVELFDEYLHQEKPAEAEAVARAFLAKVPGSVPMLSKLAGELARAGRATDALDLRRRALATNPLDRSNRILFGSAVVGAARQFVIGGKLADADALLATNADALAEDTPVAGYAIRSVAARKGGKKDDADALAEKALAVPTGRLAARLHLHANAVLFKCKPADKTAASKALTAALAEAPMPMETVSLLAAWESYFLDGLTYTGQKAQEKKIHDAMLASVTGTGPEVDFETLCYFARDRKQWKVLGKLGEALAKRFKANPTFPLMEAEAAVGKNDGRTRPYKLTKWLNDARRLATASSDERHKQLLPRIDDLLRFADPFAMMFGG